jgi:trk system potassium uptake protein TrkH
MRRAEACTTRYRAILRETGLVLAVGGALMLAPLAALPWYTSEARLAGTFLIPAALLLGVGGLLWRAFRSTVPFVLTVQDGGVIVLLSWAAVCLASAWPLMAADGLSFTQGVFESVSGWTTTGLSVVDVEHAPRLVLLWRSVMQLAGGAGLAIIMIAAITGSTGQGLSAAEGRQKQLLPHVRRSAKMVLLIYSGYAVVGAVAYRLAGMGWFDAVNHSFTAVSTGGFSTYADSIGHWDSVAVEAVTLPLMVLGNLNFVTAYLVVRGRWRAAARSGELRLSAVLWPAAALAVFLLVSRGVYLTMGKAARVALFETASALTTTGFSTAGYTQWKPVGVLVLIVLMLIGGGICSTAGGIKQFRVHLLLKSLWWSIRAQFLPADAVTQNYVYQGERRQYVDDGMVRQTAVFVVLYGGSFMLGAAVLAACGFSVRDSLFEFASAVGTVGLSVGVTSAGAPGPVLWAEALGMFLGRLEFLVVIVAVGRLVIDVRDMLKGRGGPPSPAR